MMRQVLWDRVGLHLVAEIANGGATPEVLQMPAKEMDQCVETSESQKDCDLGVAGLGNCETKFRLQSVGARRDS